MIVNRTWQRAALVSCAWILASCGGGGGGGGSSEPQVKVTSDRSSLEFAGFTGVAQASQNINFTLAGGTAGTYYGEVVPDRPADFAATFTPTSNTAATVTMTRLASAPSGQGNGSVTFRLCADAACSKVVWSQAMPYRYAVFNVDRSTLAFDGFEGAAAADKAVTLSPADTDSRLSLSVSMSRGTGWLAATRTAAGGINVSATAAALAAGSYQGSVSVQITGIANSPTVAIPVTFTVGSGFVAPTAAQLDLGAETASLTGSANVAFQGTQSRAWTATSDQPWLVVDTASGAGAGALQYHVDLARLDGIANWSAAPARVTIRAQGLTDAVLPITLNKRLPEIYSTAPATIVPGAATTVRVFGRGLSQLSGVGRISIAGATGVTGTVTSDREAVLNLPAVAAGRKAVAVSNAAGLSAWGGTLGVAARGQIGSGSVSNTGEKRSALFDPTRNAVYAVNLTESTLVRYRLVGSQWLVDGLPIAAIADMAMAPDRQTIYVGSGTNTLVAVDPDTLQVKTTHTMASSFSMSLAPSLYFTRGMAVTNNLRLWFGNSQWASMGYFDMRTRSFGSQKVAGGDLNLYSPAFYASGDGAKLFVHNPPMLSPALRSFTYAPATEIVSAPANLPSPYRGVAYDETGSKMLVDDETLYDGSTFALIGTAKITNAIGTNAVISPDGTRVYRLVTRNNDTTEADHIDVYDTSRVVAGTSAMVKVGQIALTQQATSCTTTTVYWCDTRGTLLISPLGDTLFWVGNRALIAIPIPTGLSALQAAPLQRLLRAATE